MELLKAIYQRRAVRDFTDADVTRGTVEELLRAAVQAPSAFNEQPWAFLVLHGRARLTGYSRRIKDHLLATTNPMFGLDPRIDQYADTSANLFHGADTLIVVCAKPGSYAPAEECYLAAQNLMLAAHGLGLGTCPIGFARGWFNRPEVKRELGLPEAFTAVLPITLGHPAHLPPPAPRAEPDTPGWHWDD